MGQQYSEMKCPSATAIFGLGAESIKVGLALFYQRCCCGGCPREKKKVGTVLPKVLLRWMPSRLSPLLVTAVSAASAAAADDDDDSDDDDDDDDDSGGGGDDDDDDDSDNDDNYDDDDDAFLGLPHL